MDPRPPVSPAKLRNQFTDWIEGTEMPGRTMAYLKTGMLHELLAAQPADSPAHTMLESWNGWEKGKVPPADVLSVLKDEGLLDLLGALVEA